MSLEQGKLAFYYGSWLAIPAAIIAAAVIAKTSGRSRWIAATALFLVGIFAYARFVEPKLLFTARHQSVLERCFAESGNIRLALFSDIHIGTYPNAIAVRRIVAAVNKAEPQIVFIAGDFTTRRRLDNLTEAFGALADIEAPVYAVMGNHDVGHPGRNVQAPLTKALESLGVHVIDNKKVTTRVNGAAVEIVGLSDLWEGEQDNSLMDGSGPEPRILLTHNPSTVGTIKRPGQNVDLMLAGHSHGGQIYLPFLTCRLTDACQTRRYGFKEAPKGRVFVTSGTGMSIVPLRLNVPPRIDVIDLSWRACPGT